MQGMHGGFFHNRVAQLPFYAVAWRTQRPVVLTFAKPSLLPRSRRAGGVLSRVGAPPWQRVWEQDRSRHHRFCPSFCEQRQQQHSSASLLDWKITRTPAFETTTRPAPATMTTMSVVSDEGGGRQLRKRKEAPISVSSTPQVAASVTDTGIKQITYRKKSSKTAVAASSTDDDVEPAHSKGETFATDLEARLWNLDQSNQLTSLTVVELRGLMKHISKPTAGRKEELISEVKKWLSLRHSSANRQTKVDVPRATPQSSSDAESLEGALLRAESKARQTGAISRVTECFAETDLLETLTEKKFVRNDRGEMTGEGKYLQNGTGIPSPKLPRAATPRKRTETVRTYQPENEAEKDVQPMEEDVYVEKSRAVRKGHKVVKQMEDSAIDEVSLKTAVTGQKRKTVVSKGTQTKKGKVTETEEEVVVVERTGSKEPWTMLIHKKPQADWVAYNPDTMRPKPPHNGIKTMKVISWNVNGLRALIKDKNKNVEEAQILTNLAQEENFDVLCLQETKLQEKDVEQIRKSLLAEYDDSYWSCSTSKLGYAGTAVISRVKPLSVKSGLGILDHDSEGRLITVEFETFFLLTSYVPNSGEKLVRLVYRTQEWDPALSQYIKDLEKKKPVILTGDLNCSNEEIDIHHPDGNRKTAGFTNEERESFKANFLNQGLVDTFRRQHANAVGYTYWGYRSGARPKNQGWRLDYFLVSEVLAEQVHDSYIRPDVLGSDHCPIGLILNL